jgi:beta-lactamase class A
MRIRAIGVAAVAVLAAGCAARAAAPVVVPVGAGQPRSRAAIEELIRASGADVAVACRTLDNPAGSPPRHELLIQPDVEFHAASTMKVPVMIELFRRAAIGELKLTDRLAVTNEFKSIVDGSPYSLSTGDDSDAEVYKHLGGDMSFADLCEAMITVSSNFATNLLIDRLGASTIQKTVNDLGAGGMHVLRGVEDNKAFEKGLNNVTTARALAVLLERIARLQAVDEASSRGMLGILKRQQFNDGIPAGLPAGTPVAHKTGEITKVHHDAAIVYGPKPFILVVLVRGIEDRKVSAALIAAIARVLYDEVVGARQGASWHPTQ